MDEAGARPRVKNGGVKNGRRYIRAPHGRAVPSGIADRSASGRARARPGRGCRSCGPSLHRAFAFLSVFRVLARRAAARFRSGIWGLPTPGALSMRKAPAPRGAGAVMRPTLRSVPDREKASPGIGSRGCHRRGTKPSCRRAGSAPLEEGSYERLELVALLLVA